jgi:hypothetical protein
MAVFMVAIASTVSVFKQCRYLGVDEGAVDGMFDIGRSGLRY